MLPAVSAVVMGVLAAWLGAGGRVVASAPFGGDEALGRGGVYSVVELRFRGPQQSPKDAPARDIDFHVRFRHESGTPEYRIQGFWDGDGNGGTAGNVFVVRFCPTRAGRWDLVEVQSNVSELAGQHRGGYVVAVASQHPGFWVVADQNPRWFRRSDGSHQYIFGNTHYSFLSGYEAGNRPSGNSIVDDIRGNAEYFKKLRFSLHGDRYPHPQEKPFFDSAGQPTDSGDHSHRPNPHWFHQRADLAVRTAHECDLIADLILAGPDTADSRATLRAAENAGDPTPYLKYMAARYGSYPNVWICLSNEYNIKSPRFSEAEIARLGEIIRRYLPYATPLSVHASPPVVWSETFDAFPPWNTHQIVQWKLRNIGPAADMIQKAWQSSADRPPRNRPTVNDELSYEGAGDKHSRDDTIESHLGAFLGGGYASTGEKSGNKLGQYFRGKFNVAEHTAAPHLKWLREQIDQNIAFWKMAPDSRIFQNADRGARAMAWPGEECLLGTGRAQKGIVADLPAGTWTVTRYDVLAREATVLSTTATGRYRFDAPDSRAALFHFKKNAG